MKRMADESICVFNIKINFANFAEFLGSKIQDSEENFVNPNPRFKIPGLFLSNHTNIHWS